MKIENVSNKLISNPLVYTVLVLFIILIILVIIYLFMPKFGLDANVEGVKIINYNNNNY